MAPAAASAAGAMPVLNRHGELASDEAVFTVGTGMCNVWVARYLSRTAIGAQFTDRGRQVVSMSGDGGFSMLRGDVLTLVQYDLPVKVVLFDNSLLRMVELEMLVSGLPSMGR